MQMNVEVAVPALGVGREPGGHDHLKDFGAHERWTKLGHRGGEYERVTGMTPRAQKKRGTKGEKEKREKGIDNSHDCSPWRRTAAA